MKTCIKWLFTSRKAWARLTLPCAALAAIGLAATATPALAQLLPMQRQELPSFDSRTPAAPKSQRLVQRQGSQSQLTAKLPSAVVDFDPLLDAPKFVRSTQGFLTGPNGEGRAVSASVLNALPAGDPLRPIKAFLNEYSGLFGYGAEVLNTARVKRDYVDARNGLHTIVWVEQLDGLPVFQGNLVGHITKSGELVSLSSLFVPDLAAAADNGTPGRVAIESAPPISASQAILLAGENVEAGLSAANVVATGKTAGDYSLYKTPQQASVRKVWFPLNRSAVRLAWEVFLTKPSTLESFLLIIDAQTGKVLLRNNLTCHLSDATYDVYDSYSPSPFGPGLQTPGSYQPPLTNRVLIVTPALDTNASPAGWIPDGANTTTGNNIDCYVDRNLDEQPDQPRPQGNPTRVFDFPLDLNQDPTNYIDASIVQLFWRANWYHDRLYEQGFTEAAGNYQDDNFGRGGLGNDHVICFVQAGADVGLTDNSMFAPAPDGQNGRCYMFVFTGPSPERDGSLDQEVVTHEMTHGTSWRLVGGGGMVLGSLQGNGMGEGWSDFYSQALLNPAGANPHLAYAEGGYVMYDFVGTGFNQNYYFGVRRYPYSTNMMQNPLTFKDIDPGQASAHKGVPLSPLFSPFDPRSADEVHNQGEVWCVTLWEMHANLVDKYGWAVGNELAMQLTTDGMKLTPPLPNFLQARDAILLADSVDNAGADLAEIWTAFAKRGMGFSATSPDGSTTAGVHEAFDVPIISSVNLALDHLEVSGGNGNGLIDFNECNNLNLILTNFGKTEVTGVSATLSTTTPEVAIAQPVAPYPAIPGATSATNLTPFKVSTSPSFVCGTPIEFTLIVRCDQGLAFVPFSVSTGSPGTPVRFDNVSPVVIPSPGTTNSSIVVSNITFAVNKVTVSLFVPESFDYYLKLELIAPDGTSNVLSANNGLFGQNYGLSCSPDSQRTTFDDDAVTPISSGTAPFVGAFQPDQPLSVYVEKYGTNVNGVWQLRATDQGMFDIGSIQCWSLFITPTVCADGGGECPGSDLALGITAHPDPVIAGNNLTYSIAITNNGPSTATNATVTQMLPANMLFVSASSSQGTYAVSGGVITFNLGRLSPRATASMTVVGLPTAAGTALSTVTATSEQPDFTPGNNSASVVTRVSPATADLAVTMSAAPTPALIGSPLTYTVSVTNNGPSLASDITVTNALPINATFLSVTGSLGSFTTVGHVVFWSLPGLDVAAGATATFVVVPTVEGTLTASAAAGATQFDPIAPNNTATVDTTVGPASDMALGLSESPNPVVAGSNVVYMVAVTNFGPSVASGVIVNGTLPSGINVLFTNATQGSISISNRSLIWNAGTLAGGGKASMTLTAGTISNGTLTASATVIAAQGDPNTSNNSASVSTLVTAPFVSVVAAGATLTYESGPTNGAVDPGETVTVILRLRDAGNVSTRNLVATLLATNGVTPVPPNNPQSYGILFPSGFSVGRPFSFTASGVSGGTVSPTLQLQDGTNTYPPVSYTFILPSTFAFANSNAILIPDPEAPNPPYPTGAGPGKPYPSVVNVSNLVGVLGKVTVTLSNLNHTFPGDVSALLVAPDGANSLLMAHAGTLQVAGLNLTFDESAAAPLPDSGQLFSGTYQPAAYGAAPDFPTNAPAGPYLANLGIFNGVNPNGPWSLYVLDDGGGDIGVLSNGWSLALTMITPVNQVADLALSAVATPNPVLAGGMLAYTFNITNFGPNTASSVVFTNLLPSGVTLVSASSPQVTLTTNGTSVIGSLGTLPTGTNATITVVVIPTPDAIPQGLTNAILTSLANVAANENDLNSVNNSVAVATTVNRPVAELALAQVVAPDPTVVGFTVTNTVAITNRGPGTALSVVLTEPLPPGVGFIPASSSSTVGDFINTPGAVTCILGDLVSNAAATVTIVMTNSAPGLMTNAVSLSTGSYDPVATNNSAVYVATVVNPAPQIINAGAVLTYESGPVNGAIDPGETVTLAFALANIGSLDTVNLKATLEPSGGVTSPSGPQNYGTLIYGGPSATRSFSFKAAPVLGSGAVATLQLQDERPGVTNTLAPVNFVFGVTGVTNVSTSVAISIPDHGAGSPYPSTINVSGVTGRVSKATVTLNGLTHSFPHDVNVLLVSPSGSNVLVMSHTGGGYAVTNVTLTFDDAAAAMLPNKTQITSGTYKPSSYEGPVALPGTVPPQDYYSTLSAMNWSDPNGPWSLYVFDDATGDSGAILGGWSLNLTTIVTIGPVVNLAVGLTAPASLQLGAALTNTVNITNFGPDSATSVMLTNPLAAGVNYVSASLSQGNLIGTGGGKVTCDLGTLAAGGSAKVTIVTMPTVAGSVLNSVNVAANEEDLSPTNNTAQATTTVYTETTLSGYFSGGQFHLVVTGQSGYRYVVQASTNLTSWVSLSTNMNTTGTFTFIDTTTPAPQRRFYRTLRP